MAPVPDSSSALVSVLFEAKTFLAQHYLIVITSLFLARLVYLRYLSPYRDIPGPFLATISPLWRLRGALNGTLNNDITECHKKYGPIFRIAPDEVSISDPEAIKVIYAHGSGFTKVFSSDLFQETNDRPTFIVCGETILANLFLLIPMKRLMLLSVDLSQMRIPCPPCLKWNHMSMVQLKKCVLEWVDSRIL